MKFSTLFVTAFAALAAAQSSTDASSSSAASSSVSSAAASSSSSASSASDRSSSSSSSSSSRASSSSAAAAAAGSSSSSTSSSSGSSSGSVTSSGGSATITSTIYYEYPNTFHKAVSPTLIGTKVITITEGQPTSSLSLPNGASTFGVTMSNVTTTYTSTNTFHGAVSKSWLVTETYETTMGYPTLGSSSSDGAAARYGAGEIGAFGAFMLGAAALL